MALLSLGMVVTSCSNDDEGAVNSVQIAGTHIKTFNVSQEGSGAITRTAINGSKIEWQEGDQVTIWDGTGKQTGSISQIIASDKTQATIESPVADGAKKFTAVYPQSVGTGCDFSDNGITGLVIPATQKATPDSYDPAAAIMTAYLDQTDYAETSRSDELQFKNVCAFLKLTTNKAYNSIKVSTTSGAISGTFKVSNAGSAPALTVTSDAAADKTMTLNPASGTTIAAGTYYIAVAPATVGGLKIECVTAAGSTDTYSSSTTSLARNTVYDVGELGYGVSVDEPIINFGGTDGNTATVTFTGVKNATNLTVTPDVAIATLSASAVGTDGKVTVTAKGKGTANIALGDAKTSIEVTNFNANVYEAESGGSPVTNDATTETVYLRVFDVSTLISDLSPVKYTVTGASLSTTSTPGVWKVTCGTGGYAAAKLKVTYEYKGVTFTLFEKTAP